MKRDALWTIDALGAAVAEALAEGYAGPPNGRVRDFPDRRTIRYYTTLGLLDPPAEMRGRTALYGRRHLLQLVAIKQLQAQGRSLAEVQRALVGQPDSVLERLAGRQAPGEPGAHKKDLPPNEPAVATELPPASSPSPRAAGFWRDVPGPAAAPPPRPAQPQPAPLETFQGVRLAEGLTLLLAPCRPLDEADLAAVRRAAAPLLAVLDRRRLIPRSHVKETP
jgi:DNA-binding transcriptional MerR regulator